MNSDMLRVILSAKPVFILNQDFLVYYDKQQQFRIKLGLTLVLIWEPFLPTGFQKLAFLLLQKA